MITSNERTHERTHAHDSHTWTDKDMLLSIMPKILGAFSERSIEKVCFHSSHRNSRTTYGGGPI